MYPEYSTSSSVARLLPPAGQSGLTITHDYLQNKEWEQLKAICIALKPFDEVTLHLQGHVIKGSHGVI
jgi:hypothetical protein